MFYVLTWRSALLGVACAAFTALLFGAIASIFVPWGLPALTLPFCFGTLAFVLLKDASKHFTWVPPAEVVTQEEHRRQGRTRQEARLRPLTSRPRPHEQRAFPRTPRPGRRPAGQRPDHTGAYCHCWQVSVNPPVIQMGVSADGKSIMCPVRRPGRRLSALIRPGRHPQSRSLSRQPNRAQPGRDRFHAEELLGCVSGELGLRPFLRSQGHT